MSDHLLQLSEAGAKAGNTVAAASAAVAGSNWVGWIDLERAALVSTIACAVMGLVFSTALNYWHKRRSLAIQREGLEIQRLLVESQRPAPTDATEDKADYQGNT